MSSTINMSWGWLSNLIQASLLPFWWYYTSDACVNQTLENAFFLLCGGFSVQLDGKKGCLNSAKSLYMDFN